MSYLIEYLEDPLPSSTLTSKINGYKLKSKEHSYLSLIRIASFLQTNLREIVFLSYLKDGNK